MSEPEAIKNNDTDEFYIRQDIYNRVCEDRQSLLTELAYLRVERDRLRAALEIADAAMKQSVRIGCTDHLDASDDHGAFWYEALDAIDTALASDKGGAHE